MKKTEIVVGGTYVGKPHGTTGKVPRRIVVGEGDFRGRWGQDMKDTDWVQYTADNALGVQRCTRAAFATWAKQKVEES